MSEQLKLDERTKDEILNRLYKTSSICSFCNKTVCAHSGNRHLPKTLKTDDVLMAINLGEFFFKD